MSQRTDERATRRRDVAFAVSIGSTVIVLLARSPVLLVVLGWFLGPYEETTGAGALSHRVHEVAFGVLFSWALVGALSQWRRPVQNPAGMLQLLLTLGVFTVVATTVGAGFEWSSLLLVGPAALGAVFHPGGRLLFRPPANPSPGGFALAAVMTPLLLSLAAQELSLASSRAQGHTTHWAGMAAVLILFVALSGLAALRCDGYRVVACSVGSGAILYGIAVARYPFDASSHHAGLVFVAWGIGWILFAARQPGAYRRSAGSRAIRALSIPLAVVGGLMIAFVVSSFPPRVPHNLAAVPDIGAVAWEDADSGTCLTCHATGLRGAILTSHPTERCTPMEECNVGRSDCLGCHLFDQRLPPEAIVGSPSWVAPSSAAQPLDLSAVAVLLAGLEAPP